MNYKYILNVIFIISCGILKAQEYTIDHYTTQNGLPQMQVWDILQDSRGFYWITTAYGGICRFDGERFDCYDQADGLAMTNFGTREISNGKILIVGSHGISEFNGQQFTHYSHDTIRLGQNSHFQGYVHTQWGDTLILYVNRALQFYHDGDYTPIKYCEVNPRKGPSWRLRWVADTSLLMDGYHLKWDEESACFKPWLTSQSYIPNPYIYSAHTVNAPFLEKKRNDTTYYYYDHGDSLQYFRYRIGLQAETIHEPPIPFVEPNQLSETVSLFYQKKGGSQVIFTDNVNLFVSTYIDDQNNFLLSTENGMYVLRETPFQLITDSIPYVWSITEIDSGKMLFSTFRNGSYWYESNTITKVTPNEDIVQAIASKVHHYTDFDKYPFYMGACSDFGKALYLPIQNGIVKYANDRFDLLYLDLGNAFLFTHWDTIHQQLIGGSCRGVKVLQDTSIIHFIGGRRLEATSCIVSIAQQNDSLYWFGSFGSLSQWNRCTDSITNYNPKRSNCPNVGAVALDFDLDGRLWIGATNGLYFYDTHQDTFVRILPDELTNTINLVKHIKNNYLVVGVNKGIYVLDLNDFSAEAIRYKFYNHKNGFKGIEPGQNGAYEDHLGNVWIATNESVYKLYPDAIRFKTDPLRPYIRTVNDTPVAFTNDSLHMMDVNTLHITYGAIGLDRLSETLYSYRLLGHSDEWSTWNPIPQAIFDHLGSGNYVFELKTKLTGSTEQQTPTKRLYVSLEMPFYKEPDFFIWFFVLLGFAVVLVAFLINIRWKNRKIQLKSTQIALLNKELTHRVKNNLQFISSLLSMQSRRMADDSAKSALANSNNRITSIAMVYRYLDLDNSAGTVIDLNEYLRSMLAHIQHSLTDEYSNFQLIYQGHTKMMDAEMASKLGLIVNELVTNAYKHAFSDTTADATITVTLESSNNTLTIADNGVGMHTETVQRNFGSLLIDLLVEQIEGAYELDTAQGAGTRHRVRW